MCCSVLFTSLVCIDCMPPHSIATGEPQGIKSFFSLFFRTLAVTEKMFSFSTDCMILHHHPVLFQDVQDTLSAALSLSLVASVILVQSLSYSWHDMHSVRSLLL